MFPLLTMAPPNVRDMTFRTEIRVPISYNVRVALPEGYESGKGKRWPLVVFLHGSGERGDDPEVLNIHGPLKEIAAGRKIPAVVVVPQCPANEWWNATAVKALIDQSKRSFRIDPDRVAITGLSMGGYGVFDLLAKYPREFSAAAPICGALQGDPFRLTPSRALQGLPVWAVHGTDDKAVLYADGTTAVEQIKRLGADVRFETIEGGGHDVWTQTYARDDFWTWLLSHKRRR